MHAARCDSRTSQVNSKESPGNQVQPVPPLVCRAVLVTFAASRLPSVPWRPGSRHRPNTANLEAEMPAVVQHELAVEAARPRIARTAASRVRAQTTNPAQESPSFFRTRAGVIVCRGLAAGVGYAITPRTTTASIRRERVGSEDESCYETDLALTACCWSRPGWWARPPRRKRRPGPSRARSRPSGRRPAGRNGHARGPRGAQTTVSDVKGIPVRRRRALNVTLKASCRGSWRRKSPRLRWAWRKRRQSR